MICYKNKDTPTSLCLSPHSILSLPPRVVCSTAVFSVLDPLPILSLFLPIPETHLSREKTPFLGRGREGREKYIVLKTPIKTHQLYCTQTEAWNISMHKVIFQKERCREATNNGKSDLSHLQYWQSGPHLHHSKYCSEKRSLSCRAASILLNIYQTSKRGERDTHCTLSNSLLCSLAVLTFKKMIVISEYFRKEMDSNVAAG